MFKRIVTGTLTALLLFSAVTPALAGRPATRAQASLLLDAESGQILYEQNGLERNYPASTTKVLTALVAVEHGKLDQLITVSPKAVDLPPDSSSCYLEPGEQQPLENLLYGLLLNSGNDCATAIAEGLGGSEAQFVKWMNETAKRVGATHSNFANPHGLHDPNHYTTALDLALILRAALANPSIRKIMGTEEFFWPGKSERNGLYYNHNGMLAYDDTVGGKTGYTEQANLTLVNEASRNGRTVVGVTMGERFKEEQYADMKALMDYGLNDFESKPIVTKGAAFGTVPVREGKGESVPVLAAGNFIISVPKGGQSQVKVDPKLEPTLKAPVATGQQAGVLNIMDGNRLLGTVPLTTKEPVAISVLSVTGALGLAGKVLKWITLTFLGLFVFRMAVKTTRRMLRRYRRHHAVRRSNVSTGRAMSITAYRTRER